MKFISVIYMSRRNFWCMTRGDSSHLNFQLQKVDWGPSGRQNWRKTMEFWKILYIHFIRDPKGITYVRFILKIESDAKMRLAIESREEECIKLSSSGPVPVNLLSKVSFLFPFLQSKTTDNWQRDRRWRYNPNTPTTTHEQLSNVHN